MKKDKNQFGKKRRVPEILFILSIVSVIFVLVGTFSDSLFILNSAVSNKILFVAIIINYVSLRIKEKKDLIERIDKFIVILISFIICVLLFVITFPLVLSANIYWKDLLLYFLVSFYFVSLIISLKLIKES